jgi:hypothetical protein
VEVNFLLSLLPESVKLIFQITCIGLLCQGKTEYEAVREIFDKPEYYKLALGVTREIPSAETQRQGWIQSVMFQSTSM